MNQMARHSSLVQPPASGGLSIHVVDAVRGVAAAGMRVDVYKLGAKAMRLCTGAVSANGLVEAPILMTDAVAPGEYEVVFHIGEFYRKQGCVLPAIPFLDAVPFRFGIADAVQHCQLPIKITPWGFSLFRGCV